MRWACGSTSALYADPRHFATQLAQFADARRRVEDVASPLLTANTVKFFADGVIENETGALLAPYCGSLHNHGMQVWDNLADAARAVDELGFQIHIHAIGDAAARQALDAIEHVVATNGPRDRRPVIAHAQLVDDADIDRFAELGVIANMQPLWAQLDPLMSVDGAAARRERAEKQYRMHSLDESGAKLAFGSDWPVSSGAPLDGIAVAVSRQTADGIPRADGHRRRSCNRAGAYAPTPRASRIRPSRREMGPDRARRERRPGVAGQGSTRHATARLPAIRVRATYLAGKPVYRPGDERDCHVDNTVGFTAATPPPPLHGEGQLRGPSACHHWCCSDWCTWCR